MSQDAKKLSLFPAFFRVKDRYVLVVGSGSEALAKIRLVSETSALIIAVAPDPQPQLYAYLKDAVASGRCVKWIDAPFDSTMLDGVVLVFSATGDVAQDCAVANAARQAHLPVNVVDRPALCDFFTPALVNRAPIAVAIGTEGTGPVLAQLIRSRIDFLLYPDIGKLACFAGRFRKKVDSQIAKGSHRRRFWGSFFSGAVARFILDNNEQDAENYALDLLSTLQKADHLVRFLYVGHGVADWLTLSGQRALMEADIIVYDRDTASSILSMSRRDADLSAVAVTAAPVDVTQFIKRLFPKGNQILRLVTDKTRLSEEIALLGSCGIDFELVPFLTGWEENPDNTASPYPLPHISAMQRSREQAA